MEILEVPVALGLASLAAASAIRLPLRQAGKASGEYEHILTGFVLANGQAWGMGPPCRCYHCAR